MASVLKRDSIDFSAYMEETEAQHKIRKASDFVEDVIDHFHSPITEKHGDLMPWPVTHNIIRFRPGEVTLWSGFNGHGKSLVLGQLSYSFVEQGRKVCIASMEMLPYVTLARICRQVSETSKPDVEFIREFHSITGDLMYLYDHQGMVKAKEVIAVVKYAADRLGVNHFIIDSLLKCGINEDDFNGQKAFIDALTTCARDNGIHIHLVAHSRKRSGEDEIPGKMDVRGSGSITDQVDNVITTWRNKAKEKAKQEGGAYDNAEPDALLYIDKQRNGEGWEGKIRLWFNPASMSFSQFEY